MFHQTPASSLDLHYRTPSQFYPPQASISPRERYLAAVSAAKAAESEYLAAEALQRERDIIRRQLEEAELRRQSESLLYGPRASLYAPTYPHPHTYEDPLVSYRRQIQEEELLRLAATRRQQEEFEIQALRRQQSEQARRALALRVQEEQKARRLHQQQRLAARRAKEEESQLLKLLSHLQVPLPQEGLHRRVRPDVQPKQAEDITLPELIERLTGQEVTVSEIPQQQKYPVLPKAHPDVNEASVFEQLFGGHIAAKTQPRVPKVESKPHAQSQSQAIEQALSFILNGGLTDLIRQPEALAPQSSTAHSASEAGQPRADTFQQILERLGGAGVPQVVKREAAAACPSVQKETTCPSTSESQGQHLELKNLLDMFLPSGQPAEPVKKDQPAQQSSSSSSQPSVPVQPEALPLFLNQIFGGFRPDHDEKEQSSSKPSTAAQEPTAHLETLLKKQLQSRLTDEHAAEIQDTIQAILASLSDVPTTSPAASTSAGTSSKGKDKATEVPPTSSSNAPNDISKSINEVRNIEAAFLALESDFTFPSQLDFVTPPTTRPSTPIESEPSVSKLAHTSRNHPVRYYEQALSSLLTQLDAVDSLGNEGLRERRKEVVGRVERALEELEREIEGRWRTRVAKIAKAETQEAKEPPSTTHLVSEPEKVESASSASKSDVPALESVPVNSAADEATAGDDAAVFDEPTEPVSTGATPLEPHIPSDDVAIAPVDDTKETVESHQPEILSTPSEVEVLKPSATAYSPLDGSTDSVTTIRPYDASPEAVDTFLLPVSPETPTLTLKEKDHEADTGSDWSEVEA